MVLQVKQNVTHIQAVSKLKSWNDEDGARTAGTDTCSASRKIRVPWSE